jgi:N-acetylgalactosamine-N,N'-diacetylbacillosaminyl-diphospho-undecaprenol 4-alpha-N-acetylgalactosaminyltransferase
VIKNPIQNKKMDILKKEKIKIKYQYIVAAGRLNKLKAFDVLIRSFHRAKIEKNIKLVIIGEGEERQKLESLINDLDLCGSVKLLGLKSNPFKYMYNAKFLVSTSTYEGSPNVVIEALYCGVPVIATDCPTGPSEIIRNNHNGILVPVNDIDKISNAINNLCSDKILYNMLKVNAKGSVNSYQNDIICKEWLTFLNSESF